MGTKYMPTDALQSGPVWLTVIFVALVLMGCGQRELSQAELERWLEDEGHGMVIQRQVDNITLTAQYVPHALIEGKGAVRPREGGDVATPLHHFEVRIGYQDPERQGDVLMHGVSSMEEYEERMTLLNFRMEPSFELKSVAGASSPMLAHMENTYSLAHSRVIHLAFLSTPEDGDLDLVFEDPAFGTGIHHFVFEAERLSKIPSLRKNPTQAETL